MKIYYNGIIKEMADPTPSAEDIRYGIMAEIDSLKSQLSATDYKAIKFAEGLIPIADYEPIKAERQALRDRINELEAQLRITTNFD